MSDLFQNIIPSVEDGDFVFGQICMIGCVCAGTKVWKHNGEQVNIEDLVKEDGIVGYSDGTPTFGGYGLIDIITKKGITLEPINQIITPAVKPCYRIELSNGNTLECSEDHPILVQLVSSKKLCSYKEGNKRMAIYKEVFKRAHSIKVGDRVCECRNIEVFGNEKLFDARLVGMLIGDGTYGFGNTPKYSSENSELLKYVKDRYETGLSASHITKKGLQYEDIRVKGICGNLREIGIYGQTRTDKRLPNNYLRLDKESCILLLSGLYDTDGCVYSKGKRKSMITITQSNIEILKQIQLLWRKFGVICSIHKTESTIKPGRKDKNPWYTLTIAEVSSLRNACKTLDLLVDYKKSNLSQITIDIEEKGERKSWISDDYIVSKVKSIEFIGDKTIYNLSAGLSHTYLANNIITHNTAGDKESDFAGASDIMYHPSGHHMYSIPNVYDKEGSGKKEFVYFFPGYINRTGCCDENGNSDVTLAIKRILIDRYQVKYNTDDSMQIIKKIAEVPIVPAEAIVSLTYNMFPSIDASQRIGQLDANDNEYADVLVGDLVFDENNDVKFQPTNAQPIRIWPTRDNKQIGAVEIFDTPKIDKKTGKPYANRYIGGVDPYDNDQAESMSLGSIFILDIWTDTIVAEYTGRPAFANEFYEICRKLGLYYNARINYENNKKGLFTYFSSMNSTWLLTDSLDIVRDKEMFKGQTVGNSSKGTVATPAVNDWARHLLKDWLLKPFVMIKKNEKDEEVEESVRNIYRVRNRALLQEIASYNHEANFDRVSAMGMLMVLREDYMVKFGGNTKNYIEKRSNDKRFNDPFFSQFDDKINDNMMADVNDYSYPDIYAE